MEKSKVIENLFFNIVAFSYLILPIGFLFAKKENRRDSFPITIAVYGLLFFWLLPAELLDELETLLERQIWVLLEEVVEPRRVL